MQGILTSAQIENVIQSQSMCRIAFSDGQLPYVVPVSYTYDGEYIYFQTRIGKKLTLARKNPNVCINIVNLINLNNWESVIISGTFEELNQEKAKEARDLLFNRVLTLMTHSTVHKFEHNEGGVIENNDRIRDFMCRITIKEKTGRFEK